MRCYICENEIYENTWNNPFPLCAADDTQSKCCPDCNNLVISARLIMNQEWNKTTSNIKIGDQLLIFYSKHSKEPTNIIKDHRRYLSGIVTDILYDKCGVYESYKGSWGNFAVDSKTDNYVKLDE